MEVAAAIHRNLLALLDENGGEELVTASGAVDEEAVRRTIRRYCKRVVDGAIRPGLAAKVISCLYHLRPNEPPCWEEIRPFYGASEQIHPDLDPSDETIRLVEGGVRLDARTTLENLP